MAIRTNDNEIEFRHGGTKYEYKINGENGAVIGFETGYCD